MLQRNSLMCRPCAARPTLAHPRPCISSRRRSARKAALNVVAAAKKTFGSFDDMLQNSEKPLLVEFYATWCGPCQLMNDVLKAVSSNLKGTVQVVKIDTEKYPAIASRYNIQALPTTILFVNGRPVDRVEGALTQQQLQMRVTSKLQ